MTLSRQTLIAAVLAASTFPVLAQQAGTWSLSAGVTHIKPSVDSDSLTGMPNVRVGVSNDTRLTGALNYMATDHLNLHLPLGLGFRHDVTGDGVLAGFGKVAETKALPVTLIAQYRFFEANASFRPYLGAGLSYVRFYKEQGSALLTSLTNPGGPPTGVSFKSKLAPSFQVGGVYKLSDKWFVEGSYTKTLLKTRGTLSTGQTIDVRLDPNCFTVQLGYQF